MGDYYQNPRVIIDVNPYIVSRLPNLSPIHKNPLMRTIISNKTIRTIRTIRIGRLVDWVIWLDS